MLTDYKPMELTHIYMRDQESDLPSEGPKISTEGGKVILKMQIKIIIFK